MNLKSILSYLGLSPNNKAIHGALHFLTPLNTSLTTKIFNVFLMSILFTNILACSNNKNSSQPVFKTKRLHQEAPLISNQKVDSKEPVQKNILDNYTFALLNLSYQIDSQLNLSLVKKGTISFLTKNLNLEEKSIYLLRWSLVSLDEAQHPQQILSSGNEILNKLAPDLRTEISYRLQNIPLLYRRAQIVLGLDLITPSNSLYSKFESRTHIEDPEAEQLLARQTKPQSSSYRATFIPNFNQETERLLNLGKTYKDFITQLKQKDAGAFSKMTDKTPEQLESQLLSLHHLKKIDLSKELDRQAFPLPPKDLVYLIKNKSLKKSLNQALCQFWFFQKLDRQKSSVISKIAAHKITHDCENSFTQNESSHPPFFSLDKKLKIHKMGAINYLQGTHSSLNINNSLGLSVQDSDSDSKSWSWSENIGLSFNVLNLFNIGTGGNYSISKSHSTSVGSGYNASLGVSLGLNLQTNTFELEFKEYEECITLRLNPNLFSGEDSIYKNIWINELSNQRKTELATSGYFICTGVINKTPLHRKENYYFLSQPLVEDGQQDFFDPRNQMMNISFRGEKDLISLLNVLQGTVYRHSPQDKGSGHSILEDQKRIFQDIETTLPSWPGVYSEFTNTGFHH